MQIPQTEVILSKDGVELARRVVTPGEYLVGRGEDVDFRMETPLASRHHARLTINYDEWLVEDLGSSNGTFINDQPVAPHKTSRVFPTQTLRVGDATVTLRRLRASEPPDVSIAPSVAVGRTLLPEEVREQRYAIGKVVAQGGMGAILSAHDRAIRRGVAMKVMLQSGDAADVARFVEEAQITGQLEHPNIVPVHELGVDEQDQFFYTMKFVGGITMRNVLELIASRVEEAVKKYPLPALLTIFQKVCDAIAFAHSRGVIHRDLKPENIMLGDFGEVLVMDWGLAKVFGLARPTPAVGPRIVSARQTEGTGFLTMAGAIMGTPQYMAPEQARGEVETLDQRADIYALGAILFHLLYGHPPVIGRSALEIVDKAGRGEVSWPHGNELRRAPDSLVAVCRKALELDAGKRYQRVEDLQADIAAYQGGFATSAENAGVGKQVLLALRRHKALTTSIATALLLLVGVSAAFTMRVVGERNRAEQALSDLRETAPTFAAQAETFVQEQRFEEAIAKLRVATTIDRSRPEFQLRRGQILQASLKFNEARDAFRDVLALQPDHAVAKADLALTERLIGQSGSNGEIPMDARRELYEALRAGGRNAESIQLAQSIGLGSKAAAEAINTALAPWKKMREWHAKRIVRAPDGSFSLHFNGMPIQDLSPLRGLHGLPIRKIDLNETLVSDLTPLAGLRMEELLLEKTRVADLTPLQGMPLNYLAIRMTRVSSLKPLRGMPLKKLDAWSCTELSKEGLEALEGLPLEWLIVTGWKSIRSLEPLRGMKLRFLLIADCSETAFSLEPLRGMPIETLTISGNFKLTTIEALRGMPLRTLNLNGTRVADLSPLKGAPLTNLTINNSQVADLSALAGMPLVQFFCHDCPLVSDVTVLGTIPTLRQVSLAAGVDPAPLRQLPKIERLSYKVFDPPGLPSQTTAEFWAEYDAQQAGRKR